VSCRLDGCVLSELTDHGHPSLGVADGSDERQSGHGNGLSRVHTTVQTIPVEQRTKHSFLIRGVYIVGEGGSCLEFWLGGEAIFNPGELLI